MRLSIRSKLILSIGLPMLLITLGVVAIDYDKSRRLAVAQTQRQLLNQGRAQVARVRFSLRRMGQVADQLTDHVATERLLPTSFYWRVLGRALQRNRHLTAACLAFAPMQGPEARERFSPIVRRRAPAVGGQLADYSQAEWYRGAMAGQGGWFAPSRDEAGQPVAVYAVPILRDDRAVGVVAVWAELGWIGSLLDRSRLPEEQVCLVSETGQFVHPSGKSASPERQVWATLAGSLPPETEGIRVLPVGGRVFWAVYVPVEAVGWTYLAAVPEEVLLAPVREYLWSQVGLLLIALGLLEGVVILMSLTLTRPLGKLARAVRQVSVGDFHARVLGAETHDEIGDVARAFNDMLDHLNDHVRRLAVEVAARRAVESEIRVARTIQKSMLPDPAGLGPQQGLELHAVNHPARHVAGDFYDFFSTADPQTLGLLIADVSGKGVPAALYMAAARTVIRNLAHSGSLPPEDVLQQANDVLLQGNDNCMFVTILLGYLHVPTGRLTYANAGHCPPVLLDPDGKAHLVTPSTGPLLGALDEARFGSETLTLQPGQTLLLYTDGVIEAFSPDGQMFGTQRLADFLSQHAGEPLSDLAEHLVACVDAYEDHHHYDDVTLLLLRRTD